MISAKHFSTATNYKVVEVITMYDNNIKAHFVEYVERYVNVVWNKKDEIKASDASIEEKKTQVNALCIDPLVISLVRCLWLVGRQKVCLNVT